jgi:hypothetical protein
MMAAGQDGRGMRRMSGIAMDGLLADFSQLEPFQRWSILAVAAATVAYAVLRPWRKKKDPLARTPSPMSLSGQRGVEKQMTELLVELEQMARQMTAQLDTRAARLEALIREADEKIARLQQAGTALSTSPNLMQDSSQAFLPSLPDARHSQVYELADQGLSAWQVSRELNRPTGEIELILALRKPDTAGV